MHCPEEQVRCVDRGVMKRAVRWTCVRMTRPPSSACAQKKAASTLGFCSGTVPDKVFETVYLLDRRHFWRQKETRITFDCNTDRRREWFCSGDERQIFIGLREYKLLGSDKFLKIRQNLTIAPEDIV